MRPTRNSAKRSPTHQSTQPSHHTSTRPTERPSTTHSADAIIASLAGRQHGVVTRAQLLAAGVTRRQVERRTRSNRFRPLHRGVYLVGPVRPRWAPEMAAVLACGRGAVLSHRSAALLWGLLTRRPDGMPVDVTIQGSDRGRRAGILAHRVVRLDAEEVALLEGIPVTAAGRTIIDVAGVVSGRELEGAVARAERERLISHGELSLLLLRHTARPGARALRALLTGVGAPALTRSEAEDRFLALTRRYGLPAPEANVLVAGYEVDFLWRSEGIIVEVDGFAFHSSQTRFESDRRRDRDLAAAGYQVIRVTWRQIVDEPEQTMVRIGQALALAAAGR